QRLLAPAPLLPYRSLFRSERNSPERGVSAPLITGRFGVRICAGKCRRAPQMLIVGLSEKMGGSHPERATRPHRERDSPGPRESRDRKSTRLNSSHVKISYA